MQLHRKLKGGMSWTKHDIDDFITVGWAGTSECENSVAYERVILLEAGLTEQNKDERPG